MAGELFTNENGVVIKASEVSKSFHELKAVDGVNFEVRRGEIFGLVGPDGAGKTTTIRMLCGVMQADAGEMRVAGYDVGRNPEEVKCRIGYMSQRFSLYGDLTVSENLHFYANIYHCLLYTSPSPRDRTRSRMPSSA